jgi:hypothetical protein
MNNTAELQHGCRVEYGPLELRIQTTASSNGFMVYVEDPRLELARVSEQAVQSTLESAKESALSRADEYLSGRDEASQHAAQWRCS